MSAEKINFDCRHYLGERPCAPHKREGVHCRACKYYERVGPQLLIIKLGAPGDVLRTTSILEPLREAYPDGFVTWVTKEDAAPLLGGNKLVDRVATWGPLSCALAAACEFRASFNFDTSLESSALQAAARAGKKFGFTLNAAGEVVPATEEAREWLEMSVFDDVKKANKRSYQEHMYRIAGLSGKVRPPQLNLTEEELGYGERVRERIGLERGRPVVGINTGCGPRWRQKKWTREGYLRLAKRIDGELGAKVVLLGGPLEAKENKRLEKESGGIALDTGQHKLREFCAVVNLCDEVVTGDTLALHIAVALGKKVAALFGPTSASEIELFGRGKKVVAAVDCACCYKPDCEKVPNCMDLLSVEEVFAAVKEMLP